jgi:nicotinamide-nucleotide amidase
MSPATRVTPLAAVLLTGDELLDGRVRDTNGAYLSRSLIERGFRVRAVVVAPDDRATIAGHLKRLLADAPRVLVVSGGLGTTHDDVTMAAVAQAAGLELREHPEAWQAVLEQVCAVAARRGIDVEPLLEQARKQALLPVGATPLAPAGVAPGAVLTVDGTTIVVLPGVPRELEAMWPPVLERLAAVAQAEPPRVRLLRLYGVGEMQVVPVLEAARHDLLDVAVTASVGEITLRLAAPSGAAATRQMVRLVEALSAALPVYSSDGRTVDELVADTLRAAGATVAVAESCTGGLLGGRLTTLPGSSDYFLGGVVAYADSVKTGLLRVPQEQLDAHGAVSPQVAGSMAHGVRSLTGATYGLSTTGIAGPAGGTTDKPVGLVYIGCAGPQGERVAEHRIGGDRQTVRRWTVTAALHLLRRCLEA